MGTRTKAHLLALALGLLAGPGPAHAAISGTVVRQSDGGPVSGALVTAAGPGQTPVNASTGVDGRFSLDVAGSGPFGVGVQAAGFANQSLAGVEANATLPPVPLTPATFVPLPINVGPTNWVLADATSGIFYSLMVGAPELYRTLDYGGTWQQVTASYDDADDGLRNTNSRNVLAVSRVPGEVAVATDGIGVSYSTDFGLTWRRVAGDFRVPAWAPRRDPLLFWGHAAPGAPNVLLLADQNVDGSWSVRRADMSAAQPTWAVEPGDPFGTGSEIHHAHSRTGSFVGRVDTNGGLSFAPLTASGPFAFGPEEASGLPTPPRLVRLGGALEDAAPPAGLFVVGGSSGSVKAQMLTKAAGAASFAGASASTQTPIGPECLSEGLGAQDGSITPTTVGENGIASVERCFFRKTGTGALALQSGEANQGVTGGAYDAQWGNGSFVAFKTGITFGGATLGPLKYARVNADGVPTTELDMGEGGTGRQSGGFTLSGLTSAAVGDTVYGPGGANQQAVALLTDSLASLDGGATMVPVLPRGAEWSNAVEWWRGASGDWLLFGYAGRCGAPDNSPMMTALLNWDGARTLNGPNLEGARCADLGGPAGPDPSQGPGHSVTSLEALPGTDTVFIGLGSLTNSGTGKLYRARLVPGEPPSLTEVFRIDEAAGVTLANQPASMAYCPSIGGDSDVLFAALGALYEHGIEVPGGLVRITGATTGQPSATVIGSVRAAAADVRAACDAGVVYAGGFNGIPGVTGGPGSVPPTPFFKSTDGGKTFTQISIPGLGVPSLLGEITAIGLHPADPNDVKVAAETPAIVAHSADGGVTWTIVSDPNTARNNRVNDMEYPPGVAAGSSSLARLPVGRTAALGALSPIVGTSGGAFRGDIAATEGIVAVTLTPSSTAAVGRRVTTLPSDNLPVTLPGSAAIFQRSNGLGASVLAGNSWSSPAPLGGTAAGDAFPVAAVDASRRLHVAFARASGIHVMTRDASGRWSRPVRVSTARGDTLPSITAVGTEAHVAFLRTRGRRRGVWHAAKRRGRWGRATLVRGTGKADVRVSLGGPALDGAGGLKLVFPRAGRKGGIHYVTARRTRRGIRWSRTKRLTKGRGDAQPAIVTGPRRVNYVVFRRRDGLALLRGGRRWSLRRLPGTIAADTDPALALAGPGLGLVFARPAGPAPGIHYAVASAAGRFGAPQRLTSSAADRNPSLRADPEPQNRVTVVLERR